MICARAEWALAQIPHEQSERLTAAVRSQDYLRSVCAEIVRLERVVFHAMEDADWSQSQRVGEQILVAEIVLRHRGHAEGVYYALRGMEQGGKPWAAAVHDLASYIHSYFTTPLGIIMRSDLFGEEAAFLSPEALDWVQGRSGPSEAVGASG